MTRPHLVGGRRIDVTIRPGVQRILSGAAAARVVAGALAAGGAPNPASLSVILTDDVEIEELNVTHLGHEGPTDVLSFPLLGPSAYPPHEGRPAEGRRSAPGAPSRRSAPGAPGARGAPGAPSRRGTRGAVEGFILPPGTVPHLGDIVVSVERAIVQASEGRGGQTSDRRWDPVDELRLLLTHGTLHICGWDHAKPTEEAAMRALEQQLLGDEPA